MITPLPKTPPPFIDITTPVINSTLIKPKKQAAKKSEENETLETRRNKPFSLSNSNVRFYSREKMLTQIYDMHNKEKPYFCDICYFKCPDYISLKSHLKDLHGKVTRQVPYLCPYCMSTFSCYKKWKNHLIYHHKNEPLQSS